MPEEGRSEVLIAQVPRNRYVWFFSLAVLGLVIDLISKHLVFEQLGFPGGQRAEPFFDHWVMFTLVTSVNEGALWGIGQGYTWVFAVLSVVAIVAVCVWLFAFKAANSLWLTIALGLIMAGTLGNLYDRAGMHGIQVNGSPLFGVRDFLLFTFGGWPWPVFNCADCFLVAGAIMLGIQAFQLEEPAETPATAIPARSTTPSEPGSTQQSAVS
ncbi:MAG: signal peptidase II [Planctomycetota bacterium]|nr:signal peptidase II [Planctomycetota bacterium]MDA1250075.1 signal peptidase II [Planctomycetota bacterium]